MPLHATGPAATAFSRPPPLQPPRLLEQPVTTEQLFLPLPSSSGHQGGTLVGVCTRPWAPSLGPPGLFSVVNVGQGQGGVGDLGWLQRGRLAWALSGALGACSLPPVGRGVVFQLAGRSRPRRLPTCPRHRSVVGQNLDLLSVPKASGILRPPPHFPGSCTVRPWPSHQGPATLRSFMCLVSGKSSHFQGPAGCVVPEYGSLGRHSTSRGKASLAQHRPPPLRSHLCSPGERI